MKEVYIKDKAEYIAGPNMLLKNELDELKNAVKEKEDEWVQSILKIADEVFGEAIETLLDKLKKRDMLRKDDKELFICLRYEYLLTLMRKLK